MKIHFDIDCTPQEARAFLGLPDLSSVHDVYVERMKALARDGLTTADIERMLKSWSPFLEGGFDVWSRAMQQMAGGGSSSSGKG
jgi:hypothetical protein